MANTVQHCSIMQKQDVRMAVHGDDFVCLSDDDGRKHSDSLLKSTHTNKRHGNTWIRRFGCEKSSVVETSVQSWDRTNWTILGN